MKTLLDTSFILTAVRQKIDFFEDLQTKGYKILIPDKVIREITSLAKANRKTKIRENAGLALKIILSNDFEKIELKGQNADKAIIKFSKENPDVAVATLDKEIKDKVKSQKLVIRGKKKIEVV